VGKYGKAGQATGATIIGRMRFACCINGSINIHSEYVILIAISLQQQWLRERALVLLLYVRYLSCLTF
jgi:hypothetical protein